uniref:C-type lectin domain-containing protein n=1 Tax=Echeneis naucrates TaxID=173247 RepID=A0A665W8X3_ECHNA
MSRLKSTCQVILIVVLLGLFCAVTGVLFIQMNKSKSVTAELHQELNMILMSTLENCKNKHMNQLLIKEQQTSKQLQTENKKQRSILFSEKLSFIWRLCNRSTLQCTRCLPGWVEHASRCFFLSPVAEKWEVARRNCLEMGGDLAVVLSPEDQENPQVNFHSAWIGLQDMVKEGTHFWVNGKRISSALRYWKDMEPNNAIASWDHDRAGQDCVAIVPPRHVGVGKWLNSWDDIVCGGKRHYLCETMVLSWS